MFSYNAIPITCIERRLENLSLIGLNVMRIDLCNVIPSETTTLVDILSQNPQVRAVVMGVGVTNDVIEMPKSVMYDKTQKFYNCENIKTITVCFYNPPTVPLPFGLDELVIDLSLGNPTGGKIGAYLSKVITGKCAPVVKLLYVDNVTDWEGFGVPERVSELRTDRRRNLDKNLLAALKGNNFERLERNETECVFVRIPLRDLIVTPPRVKP